MNGQQKEHIRINLVRLINCTKNKDGWYNHLLENKFLCPGIWQRIKNTAIDEDSIIREIYLECMKTPHYDLLIESLKNSENNNAASILEESFFETPKTPKTIWFGIKSGTKLVKGRDTELETIHSFWLESERDDSLTFIGITGLGGIGKTELAKKYAHKVYTEFKIHCIWINAENSSTCFDSFKALAKEIGVSIHEATGKEKTIETLSIDAYKWLSKEKYLIIFDNLDSYEGDFLECFVDYTKQLPPNHPKPFVLLTSRYQLLHDVFGEMAKQIDLSVLSESSAISFFQEALNVSAEDKNISHNLEVLCQQLNCLPLAMQQAAAYINAQKRNSNVAIELNKYLLSLSILEEESKKLLEHPMPKYQDFSRPVYMTWQITLDKIKRVPVIGPEAILALQIISFFKSENIRCIFVNNIIDVYRSATPDADLLPFESSLEIFHLLGDYSMCQINKEDNESFFSVHRLVQAVGQIKLKVEKNWDEMLNELLCIVFHFPSTITKKDISHIVSLLQCTKNCTSKIINKTEFYRLLEITCEAYTFSNNYLEGRIFFEFAIHQLKQMLQEECQLSLSMKSKYGHFLLTLGEFETAHDVLEETFQRQIQLLSSQRIPFSKYLIAENALDTKYLLGYACAQKGNHENALKIFSYLREFDQRVYGIEHDWILLLKHNVAVTISEGYPDEGLKMIFETSVDAKKLLENIFDTMKTNKLAFCSVQNHKSVNNLKTILKEMTPFLINDIADMKTLNPRNFIASMHVVLKEKYGAVVKIMQEAIDSLEKIMGLEHPTVLLSKNCIALVHMGTGEHDVAMKILLEVKNGRERVFGNEHPFTLSTKQNIALILITTGKYEEALKMLLEVLERRQRSLGNEHPNTLTTKHNIALIHVKKENYDEAMILFSEVLAIRKRVLGIEHQGTIATKFEIANIHLKKENYDEAMVLYIEVIDFTERVFGIDHENTLALKVIIAHRHMQKEKWDEALELLLTVCGDSVLGFQHPVLVFTKACIAFIYIQNESYDDGLRLLLDTLDGVESVPGLAVPITVMKKCAIAFIHLKKQNYDDTLRVLLEALDDMKVMFGIEHPHTRIAENAISFICDKENHTEVKKKLVELQKSAAKFMFDIKINLSNIGNISGHFITQSGEFSQLQLPSLDQTLIDACPSHQIRNEINDNGQIETKETYHSYMDPHELLDTTLKEKFHLLSLDKKRKIDPNLNRILKEMTESLEKIRPQIIGLNELIDMIKNHLSLCLEFKTEILTVIYNAMEMFKQEKLIHILSEFLISSQEASAAPVMSVVIRLLISLGTNSESSQRTLLVDLGVMKKMIQLLEEKLKKPEYDEKMEVAVAFMRSATDEMPENCAALLEGGIIDLFLSLCQKFPNNTETLGNIIGVLGNLAEVSDLRPQLMKNEFINALYTLLDSAQDKHSLAGSAVYVLAHILSDGCEHWKISSLTRQQVLDKMRTNINGWDISSQRNIRYKSLKPVLGLMAVHHTVECQLLAAWKLANLTRVEPETYLPMLEKENGVNYLQNVKNNDFDLSRYTNMIFENIDMSTVNGNDNTTEQKNDVPSTITSWMVELGLF